MVCSVSAGAEEERGWFVLVLPDVALEVFPCGAVVSAHVGKLRHETPSDGLEPLLWSESEEGGGFACTGKREEAASLSEDF